MMSFLLLPNELLVQISLLLSSECDMSRLSRTCSHLYSLLNPVLYRHNSMHSKSSALLWAVRRNVPETLERAMQYDTDLKASLPHLLHFAVPTGHVDIIKFLLSSGDFSPSAFDDCGFTPLMRLVDRRLPKSSRKRFDRDGSSRASRVQVARVLLQVGADMSLRNGLGETALHMAASSGNIDIAEVLVHHGANLTMEDHLGYTPFMSCLHKNPDAGLMRLLLEKLTEIPPSLSSPSTALVLLSLARSGDEEAVRVLLDYGVNPNHKTPMGETALHFASTGGNAAMMQILLDYDADPNAQNDEGCTALHLTILLGHHDAAKCLILGGTDLSLANNQIEQPLHLAISCNSPEIVNLLLCKGASMNERNGDGFTPLEIACRDGYTKLGGGMEFLLKSSQ